MNIKYFSDDLDFQIEDPEITSEIFVQNGRLFEFRTQMTNQNGNF